MVYNRTGGGGEPLVTDTTCRGQDRTKQLHSGVFERILHQKQTRGQETTRAELGGVDQDIQMRSASALVLEEDGEVTSTSSFLEGMGEADLKFRTWLPLLDKFRSQINRNREALSQEDNQ